VLSVNTNLISGLFLFLFQAIRSVGHILFLVWYFFLYCSCVLIRIQKVKYTLYRHWGSVQAERPIEGGEVYLYPFMTAALEGGEGSASHPGRSLSPGKTQYPLYRRLGGPQGWSGQVRKISPQKGFRSPDRPARSQSLYRLRYPARRFGYKGHGNFPKRIIYND
jgi:hypothetical protein